MRDIDREFIDQVRVGRARAGWSQKRLADALNDAGFERIHQTSIARIENGERKVTVGEALHIADLLGFQIEGVKHDHEVEAMREKHEHIRAIIGTEPNIGKLVSGRIVDPYGRNVASCKDWVQESQQRAHKAWDAASDKGEG